MLSTTDNNSNVAITWVKAEELTKSWHPRFFSPEFQELDRALSEGKHRYRHLADFAALSTAPVRERAETDAEWLVRSRRGAMVTDPAGEVAGSEKVREVPHGSLVIAPFLYGRPLVTYWDEELFQGKAVAPMSYFILTPAEDVSIAWLAAELATWESVTQLQRATIGSFMPRLDARILMELSVPVRSATEVSELSHRVIQSNMRDAAFGRTRRMVAAAQTNIRPVVFTGATFEERLRQFERHLLERHISDQRSAFFVEAATKDKAADLFVVRAIGDKPRNDLIPKRSALEPQEDPEAAKNWRAWYWSTEPHTRFEVFNSVIESPVLPSYLLSRSVGSHRTNRAGFGRWYLVPSFANIRPIIETHRRENEIDIDEVIPDIATWWERVNKQSPSLEEIEAWLRQVYRPVAAVKVIRDEKVAGVYLLFGRDQMVDPEGVRGELEATATSLAELLKQPSEIVDEAARRESIRRLSWMMHQIAGPLMRIDRVLSDLNGFLEGMPELTEHLIPNEESARRQAAMTQKPVETYSLGRRLNVMGEAIQDIRSLQYQIRRLKNAQKEPDRKAVRLHDLLSHVSHAAGHQLSGLTCEINCDEGLITELDWSAMDSALNEVIVNAVRELREQHVEDPRIAVSANRNEGKLVIEIADNALPVDCDLIENAFDEDASTYASKGQGTGLGLTIEKWTPKVGQCLK